MKPINLEFCGVNSFSEKASIDFENLTEYGIFGIFGDTGSGKSTVLDCISFALYGDVARSKGSLSEIINYKLDKAYVHFEFEIYYEGVRRKFRIEREIKKKNAVQSVRVYEEKNGALLSLSDGVRESNALLYKIIGLEQKDFEKCIALPQGEFAQFVKSARADRLKLVSRLFNLEKYGEGLFKRTNANYMRLREEVNLQKTRLEPYEAISENGLKELRKEIAQTEKDVEGLQKSLVALREEEKKYALLYEQSRERERLMLKMQALEEKKAEMKELDSSLARLEKAAAVLACKQEYAQLQQKQASERAVLTRAEKELTVAREESEKLASDDGKESEREIERLSALLLECKSADFARKEYVDCERRLEQTILKQDDEKKQFVGFSYEEERERLERAFKELGDDCDFIDFAERYGKAALLRGEYGVFARELNDLTEKHPVIAGDSNPLIAKYNGLAAGDTTDFSSLRAEYDRRRKERERLSGERLGLEKRKSRYDVHLNELQTLATEFKKLSERMKELKAQFEGKEQSETVEAQLKKKRDEKRVRDLKVKETGERLNNAALAYTKANERVKGLEESLVLFRKRLEEALQAGGFENALQAETLVREYGNAETAKKRVDDYKEAYAATRSRLRELSKDVREEATKERLDAMNGNIVRKEDELKALSGSLAVKRAERDATAQQLVKKKELEELFAKANAECVKFERLKKLLEGNKFMEFVAEEYLQTVSLNASKRLLSLTGGRYFLRYEGGFVVGDNFNGGNFRAVSTLSGGETFLVSLSLAIALSAEICARSLRPIEFFFLDEGFGTLDEKLVDVVMDSLEKLKGEHLTVGIISHVEELKHRIDKKLTVLKATEKRGSQILTE